jgi:uncharacterized protein YjbJ (UPF0337 family)
MGPLAEIKRTSSFHPTPHFFDGHRRPRLYRTCILNQLISLFKYPSRLSAKPNLGGTGGHFDPRIVQTSRFGNTGAAIMGSTADKASGLANEAAGKAKQGIGNVVGSDKLKAEGAAQELKGDAQKATGDAKAAVKDAANQTAKAINKNL